MTRIAIELVGVAVLTLLIVATSVLRVHRQWSREHPGAHERLDERQDKNA
jgi:hypothetical protein